MQSKYLPVVKAFVYRLFCLKYFAHKLIHLFLSSIMMMLLKITFSWSTRQTPSRLWRKFMSFIKIFLFIHIIRWCVCHHACANKTTKKRRLSEDERRENLCLKRQHFLSLKVYCGVLLDVKVHLTPRHSNTFSHSHVVKVTFSASSFSTSSTTIISDPKIHFYHSLRMLWEAEGISYSFLRKWQKLMGKLKHYPNRIKVS